MPALVYKTAIKHVGDGFNLLIDARHVLVAAHSTDAPTLVKGRPPDDIDIVLNADLVLSFAAAADGQPISGSSLCSSSCLRHVLAHLRANEHQLGLCMVSGPYMANDRPKVTLSSAWAYGCPGNLKDSRQPSLALKAIDITFTLRSTEKNAAANMFSERAYLPFTTALDRAFQKFVTLHLIRRYPLIFGGWRRKVDGELSYAPSIAKSVLSIIQRSTDCKFKHKCNRSLSGLDQELSSAASRARQNLAHHLNIVEPIEADKREDLSNQDIMTSSLARFLKLSVRPSCTKATKTKLSSGVYVDSDKEELQIQDEETPATTQSPQPTMLAQDLCWDDLPLLSTAQASLTVSRDSEYSLCSRIDEDSVLGLGDSDHDLILEDSSDAGDDIEDIECEDLILDDSEESYQSDNDMIYEDEDDDIQVVEDDELYWTHPNLPDDDPWEPDSSSARPTNIDFESLSAQSGSQDEELITPQDSQCLLHDNNPYSNDAFRDMLSSIDCELPTGLPDVDDAAALLSTHGSPKFFELIDSDDDTEDVLMFLDEPHANSIHDHGNIDCSSTLSNEVLGDL